MLKSGIEGKREAVVTEEMTAKTVGSGELPVYATPMLIALAEETAWRSVADELEEGQGTVGTRMDVSHDAPSKVGDKVWCETRLSEVDGRRLVFDIAVYGESGRLAKGTHERFIINNEKFMSKLG